MAWQWSIKKFAKYIVAGIAATATTLLPVLNSLPQTPEIVLITALYLALYNYASHYREPMPQQAK